jgi:hypothetical protein
MVSIGFSFAVTIDAEVLLFSKVYFPRAVVTAGQRIKAGYLHPGFEISVKSGNAAGLRQAVYLKRGTPEYF